MAAPRFLRRRTWPRAAVNGRRRRDTRPERGRHFRDAGEAVPTTSTLGRNDGLKLAPLLLTGPLHGGAKGYAITD
jgi:hypothetical protein